MNPSQIIANEFASVSVVVTSNANGAMLLVRDNKTGASQLLDALQLEALAGATEEQMDALVDPAVSWVTS